MDKLYDHQGVFVEERCRVFLIEANASDLSSEVNDNIRFLINIHTLNVREAGEIIFGEIGNKDMGVAA